MTWQRPKSRAVPKEKKTGERGKEKKTAKVFFLSKKITFESHANLRLLRTDTESARHAVIVSQKSIASSRYRVTRPGGVSLEFDFLSSVCMILIEVIGGKREAAGRWVGRAGAVPPTEGR